MFAGLKRTVLNWRLQRTARRAFQRQLGFARQPWALPRPLTTTDQIRLAQDIRRWLSQQLSETATPYGINHYGILLRLAEVQTKRVVLWTYQPPPFTRQESAAVLDQVAQQVHTLPLDTYPHATHVEAHLVSLGDILVAADDTRREDTAN